MNLDAVGITYYVNVNRNVSTFSWVKLASNGVKLSHFEGRGGSQGARIP